MNPVTYCPDCDHPTHPPGRCTRCWAPANITTRFVDRCRRNLDIQSQIEEDRLRRLSTPRFSIRRVR